MSKNEEVALDANFKGWQEKRFPTPPKDLNVFEYYCVEQFVRSFDISDSQLKSGLVGGSKDGGVDAVFMFVNGELIDAESELDPKTPNAVKLVIMQVKEGEGFSPVAVDKLYWFSDDLLDLTRKKADYHATYRPELVATMRLFKDKYGIIVGENPPLSVEFDYITKRDVEPNEDCKKSAEKVKSVVGKHFSQSQCEFRFINAAALWAQVQTRPSKKKPLKWAEARRAVILAASTLTRGRPSRFPLDRAAAIPEFTRSRINSRSNSAMLAKIPNTSRPFGVEVSTPS